MIVGSLDDSTSYIKEVGQDRGRMAGCPGFLGANAELAVEFPRFSEKEFAEAPQSDSHNHLRSVCQDLSRPPGTNWFDIFLFFRT